MLCLLGRASIFSIFFPLHYFPYFFFSTFWKISLPLSSKPFHWLFYLCYHLSNVWRLSPFVSDYSLKKMFLFIYLPMIGLSCSMWDLVLWPGIKREPPALGAWSFSHWTTRELLVFPFFIVYFEVQNYLFIHLFIWFLVLASLSLQPPPGLCNQHRNSGKQADSFPIVCSRYCITLTNGEKSYRF